MTAAASSDPMYHFVQAAIETALSMIATQPPMVIEYPPRFVSDEIQEKVFGQWDDSIRDEESELQYFRPVLYTNYREQGVCKRAKVGNQCHLVNDDNS